MLLFVLQVAHTIIYIIKLILFSYISFFPGVVCQPPSCGIRGWDAFDFRQKEGDRGCQALSDGAFQGPGVTVVYLVPENTVCDITVHMEPPPRLKTTFKAK